MKSTGHSEVGGQRVSTPLAVSGLIEQYRRFLRTSYRFADDNLRVQFDEHLAAADVVVKGPYVTLAQDFARGHDLRSLVAEGACDAELLRAGWSFGESPLYLHQERALRTGRADRSFVVTTGTGSGKTECFLLPVLDGVLRRKREGVRGIQAVLLYPMNALANDQLERLRRLLRGRDLGISFGLYTGESDTTTLALTEEPAEDERLSRDAIRRSPPDVLLTNYKQLEFLLVRREDRSMFTDALRYLVLDELHSYRGALATEIACLVRRLKALAGLTAGALVAIGTSATVTSGPDGAKVLARFATTLLGETVDDADIVGEVLVERVDSAPAYLPPAPRIDARDLARIDPSSDAAVLALAEALTGRRAASDEAISDRVAVLLAGNTIVHAIEAAARTATSLSSLAESLRETVPARRDVDLDQLVTEVEAYLLVGSVGDEAHPPRLRPKLHTFFHGVYDVALCVEPTCRTLVPHGSTHCPRCQSLAFPAALCRTCGQDFVKIRYTSPDPDSRTPTGSGDFQSDETTSFLTHGLVSDSEDDDGEDTALGSRAPSGWDAVTVCKSCGTVAKGSKGCGCGAGTVDMFERRGPLNTCPSCGDFRARGDVVTPLRTGTASSVSVLATHHLDTLHGDDRKLLVFTDNRQDAAHQAGYTQDKHRLFVLRHLIVTLLDRANGRCLHLEELPQVLFDEYRQLGFITGRPTKPERDSWIQALTYLAAMEFTRKSRQRISLEQLGLVAVEYEFLDGLAADAVFQGLACDFGLSGEEALATVRGILDVMRRKGAVTFPFFQEYIDPGRKAKYRQLEGEPFRISFSERDRKPSAFMLGRPDHIRKAQRLDGFIQENEKAGQLAAPQKLVAKLVGERRLAADFISRLLPLLIDAGILEEAKTFPIPARERVGRLKPLQIRSGVVRLRLAEQGFRCPACKTWTPYALSVCAKPQCGQSRPPEVAADEDNYYVRLYRDRRPGRLRVEEHSAQVKADDRARRESDFKEGRLEALVCTPTLELGVDIGPLLTVVLRNAPPTPANYAQRVGRAGRRLRIGFVSTFCVGSAHDRHAFEDPEWLVRGEFNPPRIKLDNPRIVDRHLRSFLLSNVSRDLPRLMGDFLDDLVTPTAWRPEKIQPLLDEVASRRSELARTLAGLFEDDRRAGRSSTCDEGHAVGIVDGFGALLTATIEAWWQRVHQLDAEFHEYSKIGSPRKDEKKAQAHKRAFRDLTQDRNRAYVLNYLSTRDVLPAYQFPLDAFTLDPGVQDTGELHRPSSIAIEEFAPGNFVYANGHKLKSIRVLFAGGPGRRDSGSGGTGAERAGRLLGHHFCETCDECIEAPANDCPRCRSSLGPAVDVLFVEAFEAEENVRIGSDEESRQRQYHDRRDHLLRPRDSSSRVYPYPLAPVETIGLAEILVTNWGPRRWRSSAGERFHLCPECGRHLSTNPDVVKAEMARKPKRKGAQGSSASHKTPAAKRLEEELARHARFCAGGHVPLVLGYRYRADALVLEIPARGDLSPDEPAAKSPVLTTLTEALVAGASALLELEPGELGAFPRRAPPDRHGDEIVIYENVPGGAGYIEEIASRLPEVADTARERLYGHECARACYLCLKHYRNQGWHSVFDKNLIRDVLRELASLEKVEPEPCAPGEAAEKIETMLVDRRLSAESKVYPKGAIEEILLKALAVIDGLPSPLRDHEIRAESGAVLTVPDFTWLDVKLAVYCDGYAYHGNAETLALDARKRNWLQKDGWIVLTYWGRTIMKDAGGCARDIADAYRDRNRGGR